MKSFKRITALLASGVLFATALVGCGGEDFYKGKWVPVEMTEGDKTIKAEDAESLLGMKLEDYLSLEFKDDSKFETKSNGTTIGEGTWKVDGDNAVVEADGESKTIKKDGDNIIFEPSEGVSVKLEKK